MHEYYLGDKAWKSFVKAYSGKFTQYSDEVFSNLVQSLLDQKDLAIVIYLKIGEENSLKWINEENQALHGLKPIDCLKGKMLLGLRAVLMRLPW